jgi:hypothetical protein
MEAFQCSNKIVKNYTYYLQSKMGHGPKLSFYMQNLSLSLSRSGHSPLPLNGPSWAESNCADGLSVVWEALKSPAHTCNDGGVRGLSTLLYAARPVRHPKPPPRHY